jgi:hypothetical protein
MNPWQTLTQILYMNTFEKEAYKKRTVFLSGKVTGLWRPWVVLKFGWYSFWFTYLGYEVKNPVKFINKTCRKRCPERQILECCIKILMNCGSIFMIPGWRKSKGANDEIREAAKNGLTCLNSDWPGWNTYKEFEARKMMCEFEGNVSLFNDLKML